MKEFMHSLGLAACVTLGLYFDDRFKKVKFIWFRYILILLFFLMLSLVSGKLFSQQYIVNESISGEFFTFEKESYFHEKLSDYLNDQMALPEQTRKEFEKKVAYFKAEGQRYYRAAGEISPMLPNAGDRAFAMEVLTLWAAKSGASGNWSFCVGSALSLFLAYSWIIMDNVLEIELNLEKSKICFESMEFYQYALLNG